VSDESSSGKDYFKTVGTMGGGKPSGQLNINALQKCFINISYK